MSVLRSALLLVLAGAALPALADQITCESRNNRTEACGTIAAGSTVRLAQQLSSSPCVEGSSWGTGPGNDSIWVSGGCRAVFEVTPAYSSSTRGDRDDRYARRDEYSARDNDGYRDEEDRRDDRGQQIASNENHLRARNACIDAAASGRSFGPDEVRVDDVHWLGQGMFAVRLDTPDGNMRCTVDREGNVRSLDER